MTKTVVFLCGLIGSGKTTYAVSHFRNYTDLDLMNAYATKSNQIEWTKRLLKINDEVCHITTAPTKQEIESFEGYVRRYLLMETDEEQCKTNILIRNRQRDINNLGKVFDANSAMALKLADCDLPFEHVRVFERS